MRCNPRKHPSHPQLSNKTHILTRPSTRLQLFIMKKHHSLTAFLLLFIFTAHAQQSKTSLLYDFIIAKNQSTKIDNINNLFEKTIVHNRSKADTILSEKLILTLNRRISAELYKNKPARISLSVPSMNGGTYKLELAQQDINTSGEFSFGSIEGTGIRKKTGTQQGLHYRGYINGDPLSIASFSVFANGEVMGLFCNGDGNFNLGKNGISPEYILYNSTAQITPPHFECATSEIPAPVSRYNKSQQSTPAPSNIIPPLLCKKVRYIGKLTINFTAIILVPTLATLLAILRRCLTRLPLCTRMKVSLSN
jgi:hypothetical protein